MSILSQANRGRIEKPIFALLYAQSKVGKTTFAASSPDPLFLDLEDSSEHLDVARLGSDKLTTYEQVIGLLQEILKEDKIPYKSIVIDSCDRLELRIHERVCRDNECHAIEDIGFSKGYIHALPYWTEILKLLRQIQQKHKVHVILIGHALVKKFTDPYKNESYDRYEIKLHHKAADIVKESVDMILFMRKDVAIMKEGKGQGAKTKAFNVDERLMHTQLEPAFDAGSRIALPSSFEVPEHNGFKVLLDLTKVAKDLTAADLYKQCCAAILNVKDEESRKTIKDYVDKHKNDKGAMQASLERIIAKTREH
jgi:hypothetical protein